MRNRICFMLPVVVAMLLVACDDGIRTTESTIEAPGTPTTATPETATADPSEPGAENPEVSTATSREPTPGTPTLTVGEPITVGGFPHMAVDAEYVWATSVEEDAIVRIDPAARAVTGGLQGLGMPGDVTVLDGHVWVSAEALLRIDRDAVDIDAAMPAVAGPYELAAGFGSLWTVGDVEEDLTPPSSGAPAVPIDPAIIRIDPQEEEVTACIRIAGVCTSPGEGQAPSVIQLAISDDAVWVLTSCSGDSGYVHVYRIDPATDTSRLVTIVSDENDREIAAEAMTVVDGTPWLAAGYLDSEAGIPSWLVRIDADGTYEQLGELGRWPRGIAHADGFLWVTDCADATVTQVDPSTGDVVGEPILIGTPMPEDINDAEEFSCLGEIVVHDTTLWISAIVDGTVIPVDVGN
jgi:streptogramin lyase